MEEALVAKLLASAGVTALVGNRINWTRRPQGNATPAVVLNMIDGSPGYTLAGPDGLYRNRVQVDCWAKTYAQAKLTARAVDAALSGFKGVSGGVSFRAVFIDSERDDYAAEGPDPLNRTMLDLMVWHSPS